MERDFRPPQDASNMLVPNKEIFVGKKQMPMGLAVLGFESPQSIKTALHKRIAKGDFGYPEYPEELRDTLVDRLDNLYDWKINPEWIVWTAGVVPSLTVAARSVGKDRDSVVTQTPIYPPFLRVPELANRNLITVPLAESDNQWQMDFNKLESAITPDTRALLLSNPHNPVGRSYTKDELSNVAEISKRNNLVVCSDEIFSDLLLDQEKRHIPIASLDEEIADQSITVMSPSKTFNLSGFSSSFAVIPNDEIRSIFDKNKKILPGMDIGGITAAKTVYEDKDGECEVWRLDLVDTLRKNRDIVSDYVAQTPRLTVNNVEATYLAWLDVRALQLDDPFSHFMKAGVELKDGREFGAPGFVRLNFGFPQNKVAEAMEKITSSVR